MVQAKLEQHAEAKDTKDKAKILLRRVDASKIGETLEDYDRMVTIRYS